MPSTQSPSGIYFFMSHFATLARNITEIDPLCAFCMGALLAVRGSFSLKVVLAAVLLGFNARHSGR